MSTAHTEHNGESLYLARGKAVEVIKAYLTLTKPRITVLLLFTAYAAMIVAGDGFPPFRETILGLFGLGLSAGGAAAINMWYDRDIDMVMTRTAKRPLPMGIITPTGAISFGLILGMASVMLLGFSVNWLAAGLSAGGYVYYAVVYTMLLKRRTPQNIVVGGGAGAFPPLVGWAVVTGHLSPTAVLMFAIIFLWTPSHFWGLALYKKEDYARAGVPMMPVAKGARSTKHQMVVYAILLLAASLAITPAMEARLLYFTLAIALGLGFLYVNWRLWLEPDHQSTWAKRTFFASLLHLPAIFIVMVLCALL